MPVTSDSAPHLKKRKMEMEISESALFSPAEPTIPALPVDLMLMIFDELTTEERSPLGTSCMKFREIDFELASKTFDTIYVDLAPSIVYITGVISGIHYNIYNYDFLPKEQSYHSLRLFRKAKAKRLEFLINKPTIDESQIALISDLTKTVRSRDIRMHFGAECSDYERFLILLKNREVDKSSVCIDWDSENNPDEIRKMLMTLPKMHKLRLPKTSLENSNNLILNDETLLHFVAQSNFTESEILGDFTPQGILNVCEMFRKSEADKYVSFWAEKSVMDSLNLMPQTKFEGINFVWSIGIDRSQALIKIRN